MNISAPFIKRPVATTLLTLGIALPACWHFPNCRSRRCRKSIFRPSRSAPSFPAPVPKPWRPASPSRSNVISAQIADVTEMTSQSAIGQARITLQFDLNRDIDGAARDVQAAIIAARADLPASLKPIRPTARSIRPMRRS